jgi:acid phosphatase (class A)
VRAFSCALGAAPDEKSSPKLMLLLERARIDALAATDPVKAKYARTRPFIGNDAPICNGMRSTTPTAMAGGGTSYPSGHSTLGWTVSLILAELAPDRTSLLVARARSYGESRIVCGVHFVSDIEAGRVVGSAVFGALDGNAAFRADLDAARTELTALRAGAGQSADCTLTDRFSTERPY